MLLVALPAGTTTCL